MAAVSGKLFAFQWIKETQIVVWDEGPISALARRNQDRNEINDLPARLGGTPVNFGTAIDAVLMSGNSCPTYTRAWCRKDTAMKAAGSQNLAAVALVGAL